MTSTALMFNPIRYAKKLVEVGFTQEQAELQAEVQAEGIKEAINEVVDEKLATKVDLEKVKSELKLDINELKLDIKELENRLLIKLGGLMLAGVTLLAFLMKLLK